jgi:hypothetical protein
MKFWRRTIVILDQSTAIKAPYRWWPPSSPLVDSFEETAMRPFYYLTVQNAVVVHLHDITVGLRIQLLSYLLQLPSKEDLLFADRIRISNFQFSILNDSFLLKLALNSRV